jgi:hypothetical protein
VLVEEVEVVLAQQVVQEAQAVLLVAEAECIRQPAASRAMIHKT